MGLKDSKQSTTSSVQPYSPTIAPLNNIVGDISSLQGNYQPNATQTGALNQLTTNAQNMPNYGAQAGTVAGNFLNGDPSGLLNPALSQYQSTMNPVANASLDPTQTPGIASLLDTIRNDTTNSVNGMFAGAGRDLSGLNSQYLARGISQGEAQPLLNQYNQNVTNRQNAANGLLQASGTTADALGKNQTQGFNMAQLVPGLTNQNANSVLSAQQQATNLPINNLASLEALLLPIAGAGKQGQSTTTNDPSTLSSLSQMMGILGGTNSSGSNGLFGNIGTGLNFLSAL